MTDLKATGEDVGCSLIISDPRTQAPPQTDRYGVQPWSADALVCVGQTLDLQVRQPQASLMVRGVQLEPSEPSAGCFTSGRTSLTFRWFLGSAFFLASQSCSQFQFQFQFQPPRCRTSPDSTQRGAVGDQTLATAGIGFLAPWSEIPTLANAAEPESDTAQLTILPGTSHHECLPWWFLVPLRREGRYRVHTVSRGRTGLRQQADREYEGGSAGQDTPTVRERHLALGNS